MATDDLVRVPDGTIQRIVDGYGIARTGTEEAERRVVVCHPDRETRVPGYKVIAPGFAGDYREEECTPLN